MSALQTMRQISYMRHQDLQWTRNLQRRDLYSVTSVSSGHVLGSLDALKQELEASLTPYQYAQ